MLPGVAAKHLRTLLCVQVYRPWERLTLHPVRMCLSVVVVEYGGHERSSFIHWLRFLGWGGHHRLLAVGTLSYMIPSSICHSS